MSLEQLIQTGNYASAQEAFTAITTASVEVRDDQLWTWAGIAQLAGDETADALEQYLVSVGRTWVISQLGGTGLPLSDPKIQELLLGLAPTIHGCAILAAQGVSLKAPWQVAGLAQAPTLQEVQTTWSTLQAEPDTWAEEILLTVNKQPSGQVMAFARITPVGLLNGQEIRREEAQVITNGELITAVSPILESLSNG